MARQLRVRFLGTFSNVECERGLFPVNREHRLAVQHPVFCASTAKKAMMGQKSKETFASPCTYATWAGTLVLSMP